MNSISHARSPILHLSTTPHSTKHELHPSASSPTSLSLTLLPDIRANDMVLTETLPDLWRENTQSLTSMRPPAETHTPASPPSNAHECIRNTLPPPRTEIAVGHTGGGAEEENVQSMIEIMFVEDDGFSSGAEALDTEVPIKVTAHTTKSEKRHDANCMLQGV